MGLWLLLSTVNKTCSKLAVEKRTFKIVFFSAKNKNKKMREKFVDGFQFAETAETLLLMH
jgi:hypothetical protein